MTNLQTTRNDASFKRESLIREGFEGFVTVGTFRDDEMKAKEVPREPGIYIMLHESNMKPVFVVKSLAGWFKKKDPTVAREILESNWIENAHIIYIGESGDLRRRIKDFVRFGAGKAVAHRGGCIAWQVEDPRGYVIAWKPIESKESALAYEQRLLLDFAQTYGSLPFANRRF